MATASPGPDRAAAEPIIPIVGMTCAACVLRVEKALNRVPGVHNAVVDLVSQTARVEGTAPLTALRAAVRAAGYEVPEAAPGGPARTTARARAALLEEAEDRAERRLVRDMWIAVAFGAPLTILGMAHGLLPETIGWMVVQAVLATALVAGPGRRFFAGAWKALRARTADMNTLVALGVLAAWGYSAAMFGVGVARGHVHGLPMYFEAAGAIIAFVLIGMRLEGRARRRLSDALRGLLGLVPERATRLAGPTLEAAASEVAVATLVIGDHVLVRPGARVPVDGVVAAGSAAVNEQILTGESMPRDVVRGDRVHAGSLAEGGALVVRAEGIGDDTALGRIVDAVEAARADKAPIARTADRIASVFVPVVLALAFTTLVVHFAIGAPLDVGLGRTIAVLVIACPCALGIATPAAVAVASARAAELGLLVRGGGALEALATVDTVVLDKTGTLTSGAPALVEVVADGLERDAVLRVAAAAETGSEHPLGRAIVAAHRGPRPVASAFGAFPGGGVRARVEATTVALGSAAFMRTQAVATDAWDARAGAIAGRGATPVFMAIDGSVRAILGLRDEPIPEAHATLSALRARGIRVVLASGDRREVVAAIGAALGIDEVHGELSPAGKAQLVQALEAAGRHVAMVGDGVNDAPALEAATVGIAMGQGADIAMHAADVALLRGGLAQVAVALELGRATRRNLRENLGWAFGYNLVGIPLAAGVLAPLGLELSPIFASMAMATSSVSVILNALRLKRFGRGANAAATPVAPPGPRTDAAPAPALITAPEAPPMTTTPSETTPSPSAHTDLAVTGMTCGHCQRRVAGALTAVDGVTHVDVDLASGRAHTTHAPGLDPARLAAAVVQSGYEAEVVVSAS